MGFEKKCEAVIFDLDGTLVDSEPVAAQVVFELFEKWGLSPTRDDAAYVTGRTWKSALEWLFAKYTPPIPKNEASEQIMKEYTRRVETEIPQVPGAVDMVRSLHSAGIVLGLVSGSYRADILYILKKMGIFECFSVVYGAEDYQRSKPAPDGYLKAIQTLQVTAHHTLVFEDSSAGIASASSAGCPVVAITGTNHFEQQHEGVIAKIVDFTACDAEWVRGLFQ